MKKELEKKDQEQYIHSFNQCISQMLQYMIHKSIADSGLSGLCAASCRLENGLGTQLPISPDPGGLPPVEQRCLLSACLHADILIKNFSTFLLSLLAVAARRGKVRLQTSCRSRLPYGYNRESSASNASHTNRPSSHSLQVRPHHRFNKSIRLKW